MCSSELSSSSYCWRGEEVEEEGVMALGFFLVTLFFLAVEGLAFLYVKLRIREDKRYKRVPMLLLSLAHIVHPPSRCSSPLHPS